MKINDNIKNTQKPSLMFLFIGKVFSFKKGSLMVVSLPLSFTTIEVVENLFKGISLKTIHTPLFLTAVAFSTFLMFYVMDFFTGIAASRKEDGANFSIRSDKLWRSFWKLYGYMILMFLMNSFCLAFAVIDNTFFYQVFLYLIIIMGFMFSMFEFHSIGENWEKVYGKKHEIFNFFDKVTKAVEKGIIEKIKNF